MIAVFGCLILSGAAALPGAGPVAWGTRAFHENTDSQGTPWGPEFRMTLGVFATGFEPTPENLAQWAAHWHELGTATFDPEEQRFGGWIGLPAPLPETCSPRVHIWVRDHDNVVPGTEWLLFTHPDWQWPESGASAVARPATTWIADQHSTVVMGTITRDGTALATAAIGPAQESLGAWLAARFPEGGADSLPDADPDGDGMSNRLEYYLGGDPTQAEPPVVPTLTRSAGRVRLSLPRNPAVPSRFTVETSADLADWRATTHEVVIDRPDHIEVEVPAAGNRAFFRIQLSSPPAP